jgi:pyrroline-5-carboxylate reductase
MLATGSDEKSQLRQLGVQFPGEKAVVVGAGNMGRAFSNILVRKKLVDPNDVTVIGKESTRAAELSAELGCNFTRGGYAAVSDANLVIVACKAKDLEYVLKELAPRLRDNAMVISTVPGKSFQDIRNIIGDKGSISIIIPNPAFEFGRSVSVVLQESSAHSQSSSTSLVGQLFSGGGSVFTADPSDRRSLPTASAISGCGPAFVADFVRRHAEQYSIRVPDCDEEVRQYQNDVNNNTQLQGRTFGAPNLHVAVHWLASEAIWSGMSHGFTYSQAQQLWLGAIDGYLAMRERGLSPEDIIKRVATPGGTTEAALVWWDDRYDEEIAPSIRSVISLAAKRMGA